MKSTQRIGLLLALVFLLPALFFSVYEMSSLSKDEKMIEQIYQKQLEAILFSVNQYSDDILNTWISRIESSVADVGSDSIPEKIRDVVTLNEAIAAIFVSDTLKEWPALKVFASEGPAAGVRERIDSILGQNLEQIHQLVDYRKSGFQKVSALPYPARGDDNLQCLIFITEDINHQMRVAGFLIDPATFISDLIGPRLQTIALDQFILSAFHKGTSVPVYSTSPADSARFATEALTKDFWLLPDYTLGIHPLGASIRELVRQRTTTNLLLLISLDVVLVLAVAFVFRTVKREVQLAENKADFVSNVSHEIRTPLALISMFAETLELGRAPSEEKKQEYYRIISKETQRLSGIVNKILNFSQTEANKKTFNPEPVSVDAVVKEVLNTYDFHLRNKGFEYTYHGKPDLMVLADKEAFVESCINLLDNAIKYSSEKKRIELFADTENNFGTLAVKDSGVGISAMDQKHIFDKFYRVSSGDLAKSRGTGLGLSLVKQLMEAQSGKITVTSAPGVGSTFTLWFPLHKNKTYA